MQLDQAVVGQNVITPLGVVFTALMCLLIFILPRKYALVPIIILTCYMPMGERIVVGGLNFTMIRVLTLAGWVRILARGEVRSIKLNAIDRVLILWVVSSVIAYVLLWQTVEALQNKLGLAYNATGMYFLFRALVRDWKDVVRFSQVVAIFLFPLAVAMVIENMTGRNGFAVFGGVNELTFVRNGALRCQGPFAHPILAGTFGAVLFPLMIGLWRQAGSSGVLSVVGVLSCVVIALTSASSGPALALALGGFALAMWPLRSYMPQIRWGALLLLVGLEFAMKAHVWFLMAKVDIFSGSTGYHRAYLIDRAIANIDDWWLIGTRSTAGWADEDQHLFDVTNQYLVYGSDGGLITMLLFILILVKCFGVVGRIVSVTGEKSPIPHFFVWALGAGLFSHAVTFMSVSYFDQNIVIFYLLLAAISSFDFPGVRGISQEFPDIKRGPEILAVR